jgi:hypothetical protein
VDNYSKGSVYEEKASTAAAFRARDAAMTSTTAKTRGQARRQARVWLNDHDEEEDTITLAVLANPAEVNRIRRGHRIFVTLTYAPGLETGAWCRVTNRKVSQPAGHDLKYRLDLTLKPQRPTCANPTEILAAHATVSAALAVTAGDVVWAHATISGWFGGPVDTAVDTVPIANPTFANDGDVSTYSVVDGQVFRNTGTVECRWEAELDGTYEICRIMGTFAVGSNSWQSRPPDRIEYFDPDTSSWIVLPGGYTYSPLLPSPAYWTRAAAGIHASKLALVYEQSGTAGIAGLWGWQALGIRVYDWLAYGDAV